MIDACMSADALQRPTAVELAVRLQAMLDDHIRREHAASASTVPSARSV